MVVVVRERKKTISLIKRGLMHTSHGPLARSLQAAADALATRKGEGANNVELTSLIEHNLAMDGLECLEGIEARHP